MAGLSPHLPEDLLGFALWAHLALRSFGPPLATYRRGLFLGPTDIHLLTVLRTSTNEVSVSYLGHPSFDSCPSYSYEVFPVI